MHREFERSDRPHLWPSTLQYVCIAFTHTHTLRMHMHAHADLHHDALADVQPWLALTAYAAVHHTRARLPAQLPRPRQTLSAFQKHHGTIAQGIATLAYRRYGLDSNIDRFYHPTYLSVTPATVLPEPSFAIPSIAIARTRNQGGLANRLRRTHGQTAQGPRPLQPTLCARLPHRALPSASLTKLHMFNKQKCTQSGLYSGVLSKCLCTLLALCTPSAGTGTRRMAPVASALPTNVIYSG